MFSKIIQVSLISILMFGVATTAQAVQQTAFITQDFIGGCTYCLDAIPIAKIADGARAITITSTDFCSHKFNASNSQQESSPDIIKPDDASGNGRWEKVKCVSSGGGGDFLNGGDITGADRILGNNDDYTLGFEVNNTTRLFIDKSSNNYNVGIGTLTPETKLHIAGAMKLDVLSPPASPTAGFIYNNGTDLLFYNGTGWDDLTGGGGSGQWSVLGSDIYRPTGDVAIGVTPDTSIKLKINVNTTAATPSQGLKVVIAGTETNTTYYAVNGTATGTNAKINVGVYCWTSGATQSDYCLWANAGDVRIDENILLYGSLLSQSADGSHFINANNTGNPTYASPVEGDIAYNETSKKLIMHSGTDWDTRKIVYTTDEIMELEANTSWATCTPPAIAYDGTGTVGLCLCTATNTWYPIEYKTGSVNTVASCN